MSRAINIAGFERLLAHNPRAKIIWAHAGADGSNVGWKQSFCSTSYLVNLRRMIGMENVAHVYGKSAAAPAKEAIN